MPTADFPKLVFDYPFDERSQFEAKARGYLSHAKVQQSNGAFYPVVFYDPVRLGQDLESEVSTGRKCVADPGMIVVSEVTLENMTAAINKLTEEGFFNHLKPIEATASVARNT